MVGHLVRRDPKEPGGETAVTGAELRHGAPRPLERRRGDVLGRLATPEAAPRQGMHAWRMDAVELSEGIGVGTRPLDEVELVERLRHMDQCRRGQDPGRGTTTRTRLLRASG